MEKNMIYGCLGFCLIIAVIGKSSSKPDYVLGPFSQVGYNLGRPNHGGIIHIPSVTSNNAYISIPESKYNVGVRHSIFGNNHDASRIISDHGYHHLGYGLGNQQQHHRIRFINHEYNGYKHVPDRVRVISSHGHGGYDSSSSEHPYRYSGSLNYPKIIRIIDTRGPQRRIVYDSRRENNGYNSLNNINLGFSGFGGLSAGNHVFSRGFGGLGAGNHAFSRGFGGLSAGNHAFSRGFGGLGAGNHAFGSLTPGLGNLFGSRIFGGIAEPSDKHLFKKNGQPIVPTPAQGGVIGTFAEQK